GFDLHRRILVGLRRFRRTCPARRGACRAENALGHSGRAGGQESQREQECHRDQHCEAPHHYSLAFASPNARLPGCNVMATPLNRMMLPRSTISSRLALRTPSSIFTETGFSETTFPLRTS